MFLIGCVNISPFSSACSVGARLPADISSGCRTHKAGGTTIAIAEALRSSTSLTALNTLHRFRNYFMVISGPENPTKPIKYCAPD